MNELLMSSDVFQVEIVPTLFSFILCVLMSFILRYFYIRRSFSLTGKSHIGSILPILSTVVFLVIVVVKSSLALLDGTETLYIGDSGDDTTVVIRGTLQVDGTTTTINSKMLKPLMFFSSARIYLSRFYKFF